MYAVWNLDLVALCAIQRGQLSEQSACVFPRLDAERASANTKVEQVNSHKWAREYACQSTLPGDSASESTNKFVPSLDGQTHTALTT